MTSCELPAAFFQGLAGGPYALQLGNLAIKGLRVIDDLVNEGNIIFLEQYRISVIPGCSGLKSSFSLFFLCIIYSYFIETTFLKKIGFVALSLPLALFMNVIRLLAVCFFVLYNGTEHVEAFHDNAGIVAYIIDITIVLFIARILENKEEVLDDEI